MVERVKKILEAFNMSPSFLAETLGVQRSNISHILSGRNKPSLDLIQKILIAFPEISSDWLLFGKGDMKKQKPPKPSPPAPSSPKPIKETKPQQGFDFNSENDLSKEPSQANEAIEPKQESTSPKAPSTKQVITQTKASNRGSKKIERIIIFNDDSTFKEYKPE